MDTTCTICMEDYKPNDEVAVISSCKHFFHKKCLEDWMKQKRYNPTCPMDRRRISRVNIRPRSSFQSSEDLQDNPADRRFDFLPLPQPILEPIAPIDFGNEPIRNFPRDSMDGILPPIFDDLSASDEAPNRDSFIRRAIEEHYR